MIEEVIMVRDAFNAQNFDAVSFKNAPNNSIKTDRLLAFMLLACFNENVEKQKSP